MEQHLLDTAPQSAINHDHNGWLALIDARQQNLEANIAVGALLGLLFAIPVMIVVFGISWISDADVGKALVYGMATGLFFGFIACTGYIVLRDATGAAKRTLRKLEAMRAGEVIEDGDLAVPDAEVVVPAPPVLASLPTGAELDGDARVATSA